MAAITLFCCALSFQSCELLSSLGIGKPGGDWKELGDGGFGMHVSHRSPKLSLGDDNNNLSHVDSCEVEIGTFIGGSYDGANGHYEFKDAAIIKTLTIDGEDYTIKVPIMSDGSAGGFTASIKLKRDVEKSKVLSGYIRNSGYQGYYRIVPHTLEEKKTYAPTCEKDGYTAFKCKDCRYVEERNIVDLLGHSYGEDGV